MTVWRCAVVSQLDVVYSLEHNATLFTTVVWSYDLVVFYVRSTEDNANIVVSLTSCESQPQETFKHKGYVCV